MTRLEAFKGSSTVAVVRHIMASHSTGPTRIIPVLFLLAFAAGFAINYAVPWYAHGGDRTTTEWKWAHQLSDMSSFEGARPDLYVLTGLIIGASLALLWLILTIAIPPRSWTRSREAAIASLMGVPLVFTMFGGAIGLDAAFTAGVGSGRWAVSIAGWVVVGLSVLGAIALAAILFSRIHERRTPVWLMVGAILAIGCHLALPWATTYYEKAAGSETDWSFRSTFDFDRRSASFGPGIPDPLAMLTAGLLVLAFGAIVWTNAVALLPARPRVDPIVDGGFALLTIVPLVLAAIPVGRLLGMSVGSMLDTGDRAFGLSYNAILFTGLLVGLAILTVRVVGRSATDIEEAWA